MTIRDRTGSQTINVTTSNRLRNKMLIDLALVYYYERLDTFITSDLKRPAYIYKYTAWFRVLLCTTNTYQIRVRKK